LFYSEYEPAFIENIFTQIQSKKMLEKAFIYFNNTASLAALHNARYMHNWLTILPKLNHDQANPMDRKKL
ncbi:MAG TPA: hypothetical protein VGD33_11340, partial [Chitinophagaceae bacterium]